MSLSRNKIYQGDCVELLQQLDPESVDLVFADPPFNIGYQYDVYDDDQQSDDYLAWCQQWIAGVHRSLKPNGTFWLAIGDEYAAELKIESQRAGFHCRSWVIWYYTFGVNCANGFSRSHTHLFHFVKDNQDFTFNRFNPQIRVKSARQLVYADNRANPNGRLPDNTWITRPQDAPESFSPNHDTWYFARVAGTFKEREGFHGCQMPEQLLARIIRASSHPQDLVLDPFSGSGTTLGVAKKLGRQWLGFELSKEYAKYINERLERISVGDAIEGPADPIQSAPSTANGKRRKQPTLDQQTSEAVIAAYQESGESYPVDYLLCDPELNAKFVAQCRAIGGGGSGQLWNLLLLRLRKSGKLPKSTNRPPTVTPKQMGAYEYASEVAWRLLAVDYGLTLDKIFCSPEFAKEFDRLAADYGPAGVTPLEFRRAAVSIRKRSKAARSQAAKKFADWVLPTKKLRKIAIQDCLAKIPEAPGVYLIYSGDLPLFAGETSCFRIQMEPILNNANWMDLEPTSIAFIKNEGSLSDRYALKSALVHRENPLLNCRLLRQDSEFPKPLANSPT